MPKALSYEMQLFLETKVLGLRVAEVWLLSCFSEKALRGTFQIGFNKLRISIATSYWSHETVKLVKRNLFRRSPAKSADSRQSTKSYVFTAFPYIRYGIEFLMDPAAW